jgi:hypothetical protein
MAVAVRDRLAKLMKDGRTLPEIGASTPTADFDQRTSNAAQSADQFVGQVYAELGGK